MKNKFGARLKPSPSKLEQRFVFDGAVAADAAKAVHAIATPNATLAVDSFNGVSSAFALDAVTKYADLIAPTNLVDGNQFSYRVTKDGVAGAWQSSYAAPKNDGTQDGHYQVDIKQVDGNGNESAIETIDFVLSSLAPDAPNASLVNSESGGLDNGYDTNLVSADGALANPSNVAEGSLLEYKVTYNGQDSGWQSAYQSPLTDGSADGVYNVQVRQTDIAGNVSAVESIDFTLDSSLVAPVVSATPDTSPPLTAVSSLDLSTGQTISQHSNEILFVDTTVAGYQTLVSDSRSGIDVYLLDPNQDPWAQMTDVISHYQNVSAVHLASHGSSGEIIVGDKAFGVTQLDSVSAELATWQSHMTANADVLLYGCDIASGDPGTALVNELHVLTHENIAASTDTTGSSDLGGNWVLEAKSSTVRTASAFNDSIYQDYKYELNAGTFSATTGSNVDTTGVTSGLIGAGKVIQFDPITVTTSPTSSGQLVIRAYDVDYGLKDSSGNYYAIGNASSEWDGIYLKGPTDTTFKFIGYLNGTNNNWSYSTFDVKSILQTQGTGQYSVRIIPDDNGTQTQTSNGGRWVVGTSLASFVLDGGAHTAASISALAESTSTVTATVMPTASGNYTIQFILLDPSGRGAAQVDTALTNLTANVSKSFTATLVANSNFYSSWASLPTGNYTLQATLIDSSGVVQDTKTYAYSNVQTVGNSTAKILISGLTPSSWTGSSSADVAHLATTLATPTITGAFPTAPSSTKSTTVSIYDGATLLGTVSVAKKVKSWSFAIPASKALSVGTHSITASYSSGAYVSQVYSLVVDSIYGVKPVITGLSSASWTGSSSADVAKTATTDLNPTLVGTAGANETIYIYDGSTLLGATSANSSGAWTFDVPSNAPLNNGSHSFTAKDSAFNLTSSVYSLSIDSVAPTTTISSIQISADTGSSSVDFVTGTATQDISASLSAPLGAHEILQGVVGGMSISNIAVASNVVTVTTTSAHGYSVGDIVDVSASTNTAINGTFTIASVVNSTTFTYADTTANISSVSDAGAVLKWLPVSVTSGSTSVLWTSKTLSGGYFDNSQYTAWSIQFRVVNTGVSPNLIGSVASQSYQLLTGSGAPVISTINASSSSSVVTNNIYPTIAGTADAGSLVAISAGSSLLGRVAADSTGHWSFIPASSFAEGVYSITAVETIPLSGYTSSASTSKSLTIDTTAPSVAVTAIATDSGASSIDYITNDTSLTISGTYETGSTVSAPTMDGTALSLTSSKLTQSSGSWSYNNTGINLSAGSHAFTIVATDAAGNSSTITKSILVDNAAPTVTGGSVNGNVIKLNFTDVGSGLASTITPLASTFDVRDSLNNQITVSSISIDGLTNTVTLNLATSISGRTTVLYTNPSTGSLLQDVAGNAVATFGSAQTLTDISTDTTPPAAPGAITLATASNSGVTSDSITNITTPTVNVALSAPTSGGTAPVVGDLVKVYLSSTSGTLLGTGTVTSTSISGSNTISTVAVSLSSLGSDGVKSLVATETDAKGNVSTVSSGSNVTVDTAAPLLSTATVNGSSLVLTYTDTNGVYSSKVPAASDYAVLVNGASATVSSVRISGNVVTLTLSSTVADTDTVSISYTPGTNQLQDASANLALALSNSAVANNTAPSATAISLNSDTGYSTSDLISNSGVVNISGLESGNYVQYQLNSGSWVSLASGVTQFTPTYASNGSQTVTVRQVSGAGVVSATSSITFTYDTVAPTAPTLALTTDSGLSASDKITNSGAVTVSGLEVASGTTWQYSTDGGLTWNAGSGSAVTLSGDGTKTITVKETDVAGNISTTSTPLAFTLDTDPPVLSRAVSVTSTQVRVYLSDNAGTGVDFISTAPDKSSFVAYDNVTTFTGSVSGTTLTVTSLTSGTISSSLKLNGIGVTSGTTILSQLSGTIGGVGTYSISKSQTVASTSMGLGNVVATTSLTVESATNSILLGTASLAARVEYAQPLSNGLKDIAGNLMVTTDPPVVHPTVAAAAPTLSLLAASDSGVSSDSTTNVTTPFIHVLFNGSGSSYPLAGDIVTLYLNPSSLTVDAYGSVVSGSGTYLGAATIQASDLANGYINIQTSALGVDGTKNIVAAIGDQISLSSALSSTLALTLDTTAPVLSSGTIIGDSVSGTSTINLNYTETASGLLSSQIPATTDFAINIGGVSYTPTNVSFGSGKVVLTLGFAVSDSVNASVTYTPNSNTAYRIQDQAGNYALSLSATSLSNNSTPATPIVGLASGNDSGSSMTDGVTNLDQMLVSGYRVGSTVYYRVDGGSWVSLSTPSGASTSFTPSGLADGVHTIDVKQVTASNVTSSNGSFSFTYDTTAPAEAIDSTLMVDNKINLSESDAVTISGTAEAGSVVTISLVDSATTPNTDGLTVTALANGTWSAVFDLTASTGSGFSDGTVHITATATDLAGNTASSTKSLTLDTTPPVLATATVASTTLTLTYTEVGSGMFATAPSASDFTVTKGSGNTPVVVSGVSVDATNHKVKLTLASAITNADTHVLVSYNPGSDTNAIQDIAGNLATSLSAQAVTVNSADTTPPAAPTLSLISDSGSSVTDKITNITAPVIRVALNGSGATAPVAGDTVAIFSGLTQVGTYSLTSTDVSTNHYADITLTDGVLGSDGSKSLTATITDSADNTSLASSTLSINLDTTVNAPVISGITTDSGSSSTDGITNDTSLTITGTAEASSVVTVSANGVLLGTTTADGSGNWSYIDLDTLSNGNSYSFTASATDVAGNMSSNSNVYVAVIDTVAPNAPIISGITTDTGSSTSDGITSDTSLTINGTAEASSTVSVYVGGTLSGTTTADSSGNWHYVDPDTLANGNTYSFTAKATDVAGNLSLVSNTFVASIDTAAPSAPVISGITTDTGRSTSDGITSDTSLTISGTAEANSVVTLSANGVELGTATVSGSGAWSYVDTDVLLDAHTYSFTAKATDAAGNLSLVSNTFVASIDTVAPTTPSITGITTDSGSSSTDHITNDTSLTITGTAEANSTVSVYVGGSTLLGTTVVNGSGAWSYVDPATLVDGNTYSFTATATDAAGNAGVASSAFVASIDTTAPSLSTAGVLNSTLTLTYTEAGSGMFATAPSASDFTVTTGVGNTPVAVSSVSVDAAHHKVNLTLASAITNADTNVLVSYSPGSDANAIQDIAGNLATSLANQAVTINSADTTPPAAPTLSLISDSGTSSTDKITNATAPVIRVALNGSGATAPLAGDTVDVYYGLTNVATYTLTSTDVVTNHYADITLTDGILGSDGIKSLTAKITDSSNNTSLASSALSITLDTTVSAPVISGFTTDSGSSSSDGITNNTSLTINGTADANCVISVYVGGSLSGTTTSDVSGHWSYVDPTVLSNGTSYSFTAKAIDVAGNLSLTSNAKVAQIDTLAPSAPVILSISPDTGSSTTDGITNATSLTVNGTAEAGSTVSVYVGGTLSGTTTADSYGNWHYVDPATLLDAHSYSFKATATDAAGNASADSNTYVARIDLSTPNVPVITGITTDSGRSNTDGITSDTNLTINGTAEANGIISIFVGGTLSGTTMADGSGNWSFNDPATLSNGNSYSYTATTTDEVGNTSSASTAFIAAIDTAAPGAPVISSITTDSGSSTSDGITNDTSLTITGTAEANSTVSVYVGGSTLLGTTTANGSGAWSYADPATLVDGNSYSFTATATDAAGNAGVASSAYVASIDTIAPSLATAGVSSSTLTLAYTEAGSGMFTIAPSVTDFTVTKGTGNTPVTVSSVAVDAVNKTIVLTLSSSISSADTNIKVSYSSGLDTHAIQDIAGNKALNIVAHDVTNLLGDITAPSAPAISLAAASDSGVLGDSRTNINTPLMRVNLTGVGATAPVENDRVIIYLVSGSSRTQIASYLLTATDISNQFANVAVSSLGADGTKSLTAAVVDQAGNTSGDSNTAAIVLDRSGPVLITTTINSAYLTLDYSWSGLDSNSSTPTPADYTVRVNGQSRAILSVSLNATTHIVTITVDSPVIFGDVVTVDYNNVSGHVIEDAQGNVAANFSNQAATLQSLAWINHQNFAIASAYDGVTNTTAPDSQSVISMVVTNSSNTIDTSAITQNISVVHSNAADHSAPDYIPKPVAADASTTITANWDPIVFSVLPQDVALGLQDINATRAGTQVNVVIDISRANISADGFNAYMKYLSADTIQNYLNAHVALVTLDGVTITSTSQAGWYDFTQRTPGGDGARFVTINGKITSVVITLTDNAFGDDNLTVGNIVDPGMPVYEVTTAFGPATSAVNNFHLLDANLKFDEVTTTKWNLATTVSEDGYRPLLFVDPEKSMASHLVSNALFYGEGLDYSSIIENAQYTDRVLSDFSGKQFANKDFKQSWKSGIDIQNAGYISLGVLDQHQIIKVSPVKESSLPQWLKIDEAGRVYISAEARDQKVSGVIVKVSILGADGKELILYKEISPNGIKSVTKPQDKELLSALNIDPMLKLGAINTGDFSDLQFSIPALEKQALDRKNKTKFNQQIRQAKDELYALNIVS